MRDYKLWMNAQVYTLKAGVVPSGRTITACRKICSRMRIEFPGTKTLRANMELLTKGNEKMKNIMMIDIETSGTKPGCRVLTLGAFGFDRDGNQVEFYRRFDATKLREEGFTDDLSTVEWWCSKCSKEAYVEAFGGTDNPKEGIADFKQWCYRNFAMGNDDGFEAWCCGLDFDFPILGFFFEHYGYHFPWKFYDQRDYRTIKKEFPDIVAAEGNRMSHNALEDAKAQMRGLREYKQRYSRAGAQL